ncbi:hypothetical protein LDENG_00230200 [Lucifuga dentata]|nr:hypothetical protein LDENG_00230200 [Lucifuga dentata]
MSPLSPLRSLVRAQVKPPLCCNKLALLLGSPVCSDPHQIEDQVAGWSTKAVSDRPGVSQDVTINECLGKCESTHLILLMTDTRVFRMSQR